MDSPLRFKGVEERAKEHRVVILRGKPVIVDCIKYISESIIFSVVLCTIDSEDLWALSVVHVFRIVVIFIQELLHNLIIVLFSCCIDFIKLEGGALEAIAGKQVSRGSSDNSNHIINYILTI